MRYTSILFMLCTILLTGCNFSDIKDAVADIDDAAKKASVATSEEVHSIRAIELTHNDQTFTVNDLFKRVLRDVYWHYEKEDTTSTLEVKGTWQPTLLAQYGLNTEDYPELNVTGDVTVTLTVENEQIIADRTTVVVEYDKQQILNEKGSQLLTDLYDAYTLR